MLFVLFVELAIFLYIFSAKPIDIIGAAVGAVFFAGVAYYVYLQDPVVKARRSFPSYAEEVRETGMTDLEMAKEYLVHMGFTENCRATRSIPYRRIWKWSKGVWSSSGCFPRV